MSGYARPASLDEALELLGGDGAVPLGGGTDLAGQLDRGIRVAVAARRPARRGPRGDRAERDDGLRIGAAVTLAELAASPLAEPYAAVARAASLAASPLLRNVGTVGGNLCQHTRCWYYRGEEWHCWLGGGDTCYAQIGDHRKHNLEPGDCISAHPSDLAPALAASGATVEIRAASGAREVPLLELYRRPTSDNRSLLALGPGELVVAVRLPAPPDASAYERLGERAAFSFPLVSVAAARRGDDGHGSWRPGSRTSRARSIPPTRSRASRGTRSRPGSARRSRRSPSARSRP